MHYCFHLQSSPYSFKANVNIKLYSPLEDTKWTVDICPNKYGGKILWCLSVLIYDTDKQVWKCNLYIDLKWVGGHESVNAF